MKNQQDAKNILILSDSHSYTGEDYWDKIEVSVDEIWHAGDIGRTDVTDALKKRAPLRAVYGNIDGTEIRAEFPEYQIFEVDGLRVLMIHIGGRPGSYNPKSRKLIEQFRPDIFVCGHSHICLVEKVAKYNLLHINPGAIGKHGFHKFRTCLLLSIVGSKPSKIKIIEFPR
jgi:putative phosphoesterase